uniref:Uncharacterized protein n=1 Tax=Magallana gigas TaxID=29159 RepID=A0A8W8NZ88_MAGGI
MNVLIFWAVLLAANILKGYTSASLIRKHSPSVFRIQSIKKALPLYAGGADFIATAVIKIKAEPGETFNGRILLFPMAENLVARPFEKQAGSDNQQFFYPRRWTRFGLWKRIAVRLNWITSL